MLLRCERLEPPMSQMGHSRPPLRVSAAVRCLLFPESDLLTAQQRNDAKGQNRTSTEKLANLEKATEVQLWFNVSWD